MTKQWYVLHVLTGCEPEVHRHLREQGFYALVPAEIRMIRSGGKWHQKEYRLFPGYVFVQMHYEPAKYHLIHRIPGVIRILPQGRPVPLTVQESAWIRLLGRTSLPPSAVNFSGKLPIVSSGPLLHLKRQIVKFDLHRRRALVDLPILGENKQIELSIIPILKP